MEEFHISDILTVTTGKMISIRNMEGLYDILNYMSSDNLHTHQLPRVMDLCKPYLLKQFPKFADIDISKVSEDSLLECIEKIEKEHGSYHEVEKLPSGVYKQ